VRRVLLFVGLLAAAVVLPSAVASAHPLGNFSVNQYSGLRVSAERVDVDLVVDMAEIPTFQAKKDVDAAGAAYAPSQCRELVRRVSLSVDDRVVPLRVSESAVAFPPGTAGLPTLRLTCTATAATSGGHQWVVYRDGNYGDRVGWREITAVGDGVTLSASDVPSSSTSNRLTAYPEDLLKSPLDQRSASLRVVPGGASAGLPARLEGPVHALPRGVDGPTRAFTSLVARQNLSVGFAALAVLLALGLGALHALAPGHGKTVMAAYLVGEHGGLRQAAVIGLTVTATHTAGVLVLGLALSLSAIVAPERLYPWLGLASGAMLAVIGTGLLRRALRARRHVHAHAHGHAHHHHHGPVDDLPVGTRGLLAMGFAGGLVPTPSALVVLLGAIALGRAWFGVVLVLVYGLGMAAVLTSAGVVLVRARRALDRRRAAAGVSTRLAQLAGALPVATASIIVAVGTMIAARGALAI